MTIRILPAAFADLADGRKFYERQAAGVGDYFIESLSADIDSLEKLAGIHRVVFGFHRLLARRFPWAVYYRVEEGNSVVVFRVLDCRQEPARTQRQLRPAD